MRRTRSETIAENRDAFLAGKSPEYIEKFNNKTEDQQYAAIANWKRSLKNLGEASKDLAKVSAATVVNYLKEAHRKLQSLDSLTPKESNKILGMLDSVKDTIDNFSVLKKKQLIEALQSEKEKLAKQNENLDRQIEKLQQELQ